MKRLTSEYEAQMKKYRLALEAFDSVEPLVSAAPRQQDIFKAVHAGNRKEKLIDRGAKILEKQAIPLTGRELFELLGLTNYNSFSGQFSQEYRKDGSPIDQFVLQTAHAKQKYFYCLKSWYTNGELRQEYVDKLNAKLSRSAA